LGLGVWSFLAGPAAGLRDSARGRAPQRLAAGIALGLRGLVSNIVYGFSNATAKMSGAARKVWNCPACLCPLQACFLVPWMCPCWTSSIFHFQEDQQDGC
jgi:hypothetical protein